MATTWKNRIVVRIKYEKYGHFFVCVYIYRHEPVYGTRSIFTWSTAGLNLASSFL